MSGCLYDIEKGDPKTIELLRCQNVILNLRVALYKDVPILLYQTIMYRQIRFFLITKNQNKLNDLSTRLNNNIFNINQILIVQINNESFWNLCFLS